MLVNTPNTSYLHCKQNEWQCVRQTSLLQTPPFLSKVLFFSDFDKTCQWLWLRLNYLIRVPENWRQTTMVRWHTDPLVLLHTLEVGFIETVRSAFVLSHMYDSAIPPLDRRANPPHTPTFFRGQEDANCKNLRPEKHRWSVRSCTLLVSFNSLDYMFSLFPPIIMYASLDLRSAFKWCHSLGSTFDPN